MSSSLGNHNRRVWETVLQRGYLTLEQLQDITDGTAPEFVEEKLEDVLYGHYLIDDEVYFEIVDSMPDDPYLIDEQAALGELQQTVMMNDQMDTMVDPQMGLETVMMSPEEIENANPPDAHAETEYLDPSEANTLQNIADNDLEEDEPSSTVPALYFPGQEAPKESTPPATTSKSQSSSMSSKSLTASQISKARQMSAEDLQKIERVTRGEKEELIGVNLGGYRVEGKIGAGGMGDVYEATQISLDRRVALKTLPTHLANDESFIERFYNEARTLGTFTHTNIVQVYDVGEAGGLHFFTMEKVAGHTFKDLIKDEDTVPLEVCTNLMKQCIRGLSRAHQAGVIHRDIKPGNLLITDEGDVKIVDFGLAEKVAEDGDFKSESVVGTPLYIAPEQASGDAVNFRSDMYSLGATFFHLATGQPPFRGKSAYETARMHISSPVPNPSTVNPSLPAGFSEIILKMMAKDARDRFGTYKELFDAIEAFELKSGIIKSRSDFLGDSLMAIGDHGVRGLWNKIGFMALVGFAIVLLAIAVHNIFESQRLHDWIALVGDVGTFFFAVTVLLITYVALARRRLVPVIGNIQKWMYAHIITAIISFFLVSIHGGNFFAFIYSPQSGFFNFGVRSNVYPDRTVHDFIPVIPFLNSFVFLIVIVSGLIGATIWRDIVKQITVERIQQGKKPLKSDTRLTMSVFSQTMFKYWRMIHYPLAVALGLLTLLHVISILFWRGL